MAIGVSNRDGGKTDEAGHERFAHAAFTGNVVSGLQVIQRAAGANMSVDITAGDGKISSGTGFWYAIFNDTSGGTDANITITTANPTNPRKDIIVAYIDLSQARTTSSSNNINGVLKIIAVAGTAAGSPTDPSDPTIQSAVGSGNPFIKLGRVTVTAATSSITTAMITDLRTMTNPVLNNLSIAGLAPNPYKFSAYKTTTQSSVASGTKITFDTEDFDTGSNYDSTTNHRFTAPIAGYYFFHSQLYISSANLYAGPALYKNGSLLRRGDASSSSSNSDVVASGSWFVQASANDYFEIFLIMGAGNRDITGSTAVSPGNPTHFEGWLVSV